MPLSNQNYKHSETDCQCRSQKFSITVLCTRSYGHVRLRKGWTRNNHDGKKRIVSIWQSVTVLTCHATNLDTNVSFSESISFLPHNIPTSRTCCISSDAELTLRMTRDLAPHHVPSLTRHLVIACVHFP